MSVSYSGSTSLSSLWTTDETAGRVLVGDFDSDGCGDLFTTQLQAAD